MLLTIEDSAASVAHGRRVGDAPIVKPVATGRSRASNRAASTNCPLPRAVIRALQPICRCRSDRAARTKVAAPYRSSLALFAVGDTDPF